jgi:TIR domain
LEEEIKPSAYDWQITELPQSSGKSYLFVFRATGEVHKLRGIGTFVRSDGRNRRLSVVEKNALIKKLSEKFFGQESLFDLAENVEGVDIHESSFFKSPISVSSLQVQFTEILKQVDQPRDVFISYSHQDYSLAHKLKAELQGLGLSVWIDEHVLQPGDVLTRDIAKGVCKSKVGVVFVSSASKESYWVQSEISLMLFNRRFRDREFIIVPIRVDASPFPEELVEMIYANLQEEVEEKILEVAKRIKYLVDARAA